jgi:hypothetical protein
MKGKFMAYLRKIIVNVMGGTAEKCEKLYSKQRLTHETLRRLIARHKDSVS